MHDYEEKQRGVMQESSWITSKWEQIVKKIKSKIQSVKFIKNSLCCCFFKKKSEEEDISKSKDPIILKLGLMKKEKASDLKSLNLHQNISSDGKLKKSQDSNVGSNIT